MPKITMKQQILNKDRAYNRQYNEIFKLHKFLVECPMSEHSIDNGNPIDDAITLLKKLLEK